MISHNSLEFLFLPSLKTYRFHISIIIFSCAVTVASANLNFSVWKETQGEGEKWFDFLFTVFVFAFFTLSIGFCENVTNRYFR